MQPDEYTEMLLNTAPPSTYNILIAERLAALEENQQLLHAQLGITTEAGEFADAIKRFLVYGKPIDRTNLVEELGDLTWYIGLAIAAVGTTWGEVFERNIKKLAARYPEKFSEYHALNRNLDNERKILESER